MHLISVNGLQSETLLIRAECLQYDHLLNLLSGLYNLPKTSLYLTCDNLCKDITSIKAHYRIYGGKGGFGSMLRAIGAQIEKTTNRGACRDLSGRRMRDVDSEKALKEWVKNNPDADLEKERKKQEKRDKILNPGKHYITDTNYINERSNVEENVHDALQQGLSNGTSIDSFGNKRKFKTKKEGISKILKKDLDMSLSSLDELSEEEESLQNSSLCANKHVEVLDEIHSASVQISKSNMPESKSITKNLESISELNPTLCNQQINKIEVKDFERIDLSLCSCLEDVEHFGLDHLKNELKSRGLKCGGTLHQRAERLYAKKTKF